jgi:hypothetical protein
MIGARSLPLGCGVGFHTEKTDFDGLDGIGPSVVTALACLSTKESRDALAMCSEDGETESDLDRSLC